MIEPPGPISGSAFCTVKIVPFTLVSKVLSMCSAVIWPSASRPPVPALAKTMSRVHRSGVVAELRHRGVERFLPTAVDEDEGAFLDEALRRREADAGGTAGDHGGLSIQLAHVMNPWLGGNCRSSDGDGGPIAILVAMAVRSGLLLEQVLENQRAPDAA